MTRVLETTLAAGLLGWSTDEDAMAGALAFEGRDRPGSPPNAINCPLEETPARSQAPGR
jgi:hypothetical protein